MSIESISGFELNNNEVEVFMEEENFFAGYENEEYQEEKESKLKEFLKDFFLQLMLILVVGIGVFWNVARGKENDKHFVKIYYTVMLGIIAYSSFFILMCLGVI